MLRACVGSYIVLAAGGAPQGPSLADGGNGAQPGGHYRIGGTKEDDDCRRR